MKHNKHELKYKAYIKASRRLSKLYKLKRNQPYRKLDKPYISGWWVTPVLREDYARSDDGQIVAELIKKYHKKIYTRSPAIIKRIRRKPTMEYTESLLGMYYSPRLNRTNISKEEYKKLPPRCQKFFSLIDQAWWQYRGRYVLNIASHYLKAKITHRFVTHVQEIDPDVESEIAQLETFLKPYWRAGRRYALDEYFQNRKERRKRHVEDSQLPKSWIEAHEEVWGPID